MKDDRFQKKKLNFKDITSMWRVLLFIYTKWNFFDEAVFAFKFLIDVNNDW